MWTLQEGGWKVERKENNNTGKRRGLLSTATIKQHSTTSGPLGAEGDVRTEEKPRNTWRLALYLIFSNVGGPIASPRQL